MAKIKAPLFSLDATGTLDKNITYKGKLRDQIAQKYSKPGDVNPFESSPRQKDQRSIIRLITIHWQCMSSIDKLSWENAAKDVRFKGTGYHYFLHMAQQNLTQYLGLVGYWSMNYNINDKIPDLSGNGNHGTLSPIYPCDCPTLVDSFDKKHGKAASFDGLNDHISLGLSPSLSNLTSYTYALLLSKNINGDYQSLITRYSIWFNSLFVYGNAYLRAFKAYSVTTAQSITASTLSDDLWYFIVSTYDENTDRLIHIYINGIEASYSIHIPSVGILSPDDPYVSTISKINRPLKGIIDDLRIYNRALSPLEIKRQFQCYNLN